MKYRFRATRALTRDLPLARLHHHATYAVHPPASPHGAFWRSFGKLSAQQQRNARRRFLFSNRTLFIRACVPTRSTNSPPVIYAAEIEADLRVLFYIEGDVVVTVDIGSHALYRR